jgi:hypothetical protein
VSANQEPTEYRHLVSDAPMVGDGGRVTIASRLRTRAGWPKEGVLEIIVELIGPGWAELHLESQVAHRLQRARSLPDRTEGDAKEKARLRQGVDEVWTPLTFNPSDGRLELPANILAYLGVHPQAHEPRSMVTSEGKPRGTRYGGQQVHLQAGDGYITLRSLVSATERNEDILERLKNDAGD